MCGRFTSITGPDALADLLDTEPPNPELCSEFRPNYNVPPTRRILAVARDRSGLRRLGSFQWGLVPTWAKTSSGSAKLINARSETAAEKPSFRHSVIHQRCIIPMDGFYEWRTVPSSQSSPKQPVYITRGDGLPLAVAGLWASWQDKQPGSLASWLHTCCVLTTSANSTVAPFHSRMPVILESSHWTSWLDVGTSTTPGTAMSEVTRLMAPAHESILRIINVSTAVNSVRNNTPELITEIL